MGLKNRLKHRMSLRHPIFIITRLDAFDFLLILYFCRLHFLKLHAHIVTMLYLFLYSTGGAVHINCCVLFAMLLCRRDWRPTRFPKRTFDDP